MNSRFSFYNVVTVRRKVAHVTICLLGQQDNFLNKAGDNDDDNINDRNCPHQPHLRQLPGAPPLLLWPHQTLLSTSVIIIRPDQVRSLRSGSSRNVLHTTRADLILYPPQTDQGKYTWAKYTSKNLCFVKFYYEQ